MGAVSVLFNECGATADWRRWRVGEGVEEIVWLEEHTVRLWRGMTEARDERSAYSNLLRLYT